MQLRYEWCCDRATCEARWRNGSLDLALGHQLRWLVDPGLVFADQKIRQIVALVRRHLLFRFLGQCFYNDLVADRCRGRWLGCRRLRRAQYLLLGVLCDPRVSHLRSDSLIEIFPKCFEA